MSDFDPATIYFILTESFGSWFWALVALALVLLAGIVGGIVRLRRAGASARRPLIVALAAGLLTVILCTFLVPVWTLAGPDALAAPVDVALAALIALVPGGIVGSAVFAIMAIGPNRRTAATA